MKRASFYNLQNLLTRDERSIIYEKLDWFDWHIAQIAHNPQIPHKKSGRYIEEYAKYGHLDALKTIGINCISRWICDIIIRCGHLDILKWLGDQGIQWTKHTCTTAAKDGQLDILKWLRDKNVPWDEETCNNAVYYSHLHVLEWCIAQGAPMNNWAKRYCYENGLLL